MGSTIPNAQSPIAGALPIAHIWLEFLRLLSGDVATLSGSVINVKSNPYRARGDGASDDTIAIQTAIIACPAGGAVYFPSGTYLISAAILVRKSNITIFGDGASSTIIRIKNTTGIAPTVLELGNTADGNSATAYENITVSGLTLDGNRGGTADATTDLTSWGLATTKISRSHFHDIKAINCWNGAIGTFINSDHNRWSDIYCYNSGFGIAAEPGFDVNSSKYNIFTGIIIESCNYGFRLLDNCFGNLVYVTIYDPAVIGVIYHNQNVNKSYGNLIDASIIGGASAGAFVVGANCFDSHIHLAADSVAGAGLYVMDNGAYNSNGNHYDVQTRNGQIQSVLIYTDRNTINVSSWQDGRAGSIGDNFAVDIYGDQNIITAIVEDSLPWHVRGVSFRAGADGNTVQSYKWLNTADPYNDAGSNNLFITQGRGIDIPSSNTIDIPLEGDIFALTGVAGIVTITASSCNGRTVTLISTDNVTIFDGSDLKLNGDWVSGAANSTLSLVCDGTNWYEISRSING